MKATIISAIAVGLLLCNIEKAHGTKFYLPRTERRNVLKSAVVVDGKMMCGDQCSWLAGVVSCTGKCTKEELAAIKDWYENQNSKDTKSSTVQSAQPSTVQAA